jgi:16S rRNA (guanine(966)-N(2))-methyltransferase RsmD
MRIITGKFKGRTLTIPKTDKVRPTSDRTKEGIFSVIAARRYFDNLRVLDLFAGSGNLGIEAISRGAVHCTFVDDEPAHIRHIQKTASAFGIEKLTHTLAMDTEDFLEKNSSRFDLIFADPPYDYYAMQELPDMILQKDMLAKDGWLILEHDKHNDFTKHPNCVFSKAYGRTIASIFTLSGDNF